MIKHFFTQLTTYLSVGLVNTAITITTIFLMVSYGFDDISSNLTGFVLGIISSFFLNAKYTFSSSSVPIKSFFLFIISVGISYLVNLSVLMFSLKVLNFSSYISQLFALTSYIIVNFLLLRTAVFKETN